MMVYAVLLAPFVLFLGLYLFNKARAAYRRKRRASLRAAPFPAAWREQLQIAYPLYRKLPEDLRRNMEGHMNVFLDEKIFAGRNGFVITDQVRVLIAAQACLLIMNNPRDYYPGFETILVYPDAYVTKVTRRDGMLETQTVDTRLGESWHRGPVILAWDHVVQGARDSRDGHNVVMHEFAHKLDEENYHMDGLPVLADSSQYSQWAQVLSDEFERLRAQPNDVIDAYGATSAAEFFAVVTEAFFEKSRQLKKNHPALYQQFVLYYRVDPSLWIA